jgi:hypothetical protein
MRVGGLNPWVWRLRWVVLAAIAMLGYVAPWGSVARLGWGGGGSGPNAHLWGVLAVLLGKSGVGVSRGFEIVLGVGIALAGVGALLRTVVMARGGRVGMGAVGAWLNMVALSLLMPVSGALFAVVAAAGWEWAVVSAQRRGDAARVGWAWAVVREIYFWGVAGSFAGAGWAYNAGLLARCVLVSLGVGIVARGILPRSGDGA